MTQVWLTRLEEQIISFIQQGHCQQQLIVEKLPGERPEVVLFAIGQLESLGILSRSGEEVHLMLTAVDKQNPDEETPGLL